MLFPLQPANKLIFLQSIMCDVLGVGESPPGCNVTADRATECVHAVAAVHRAQVCEVDGDSLPVMTAA